MQELRLNFEYFFNLMWNEFPFYISKYTLTNSLRYFVTDISLPSKSYTRSVDDIRHRKIYIYDTTTLV